MSGRGIISRLIRWQTRSIYSHAALLTPEGHIIESWQGDGVRLRKGLDDWSNVWVFDVPALSDEQWWQALEWATAQCGKGYDYKSVARFLTRARTSDDNRFFCSELVIAAIAKSGLRLLERIDFAQVSPGHLAISPLLQLRGYAPDLFPTTNTAA